MDIMQTLRLAPASYVILVDNSNKLGQINPPFNLLGMMGSGAAKLSYAVELGGNPD